MGEKETLRFVGSVMTGGYTCIVTFLDLWDTQSIDRDYFSCIIVNHMHGFAREMVPPIGAHSAHPSRSSVSPQDVISTALVTGPMVRSGRMDRVSHSRVRILSQSSIRGPMGVCVGRGLSNFDRGQDRCPSTMLPLPRDLSIIF